MHMIFDDQLDWSFVKDSYTSFFRIQAYPSLAILWKEISPLFIRLLAKLSIFIVLDRVAVCLYIEISFLF